MEIEPTTSTLQVRRATHWPSCWRIPRPAVLPHLLDILIKSEYSESADELNQDSCAPLWTSKNW